MAGHDPLALLRAIERRYRALDSAIDPPGADTHSWVGLALHVQGVTVLIGRDEVQALLPVPRLTRVPHVAAWVRGVARLGARPGPVIDLGGFLRGKSSRGGRRTRVVVVDARGDPVGLLVDGVSGPHRLVPEATLADVPASPPWLQPYLCGAGVINGQTVARLSIARLQESQAFYRLAC